MSNRIDEIRIELYTNIYHKEQMIDEKTLININDKLFKIQSDLRQVVNDDINIDNAKGIFYLD